MAFEWDPITFINLLLCIVIVLLGALCYRKNREHLPLLVAGAFGLFGVSHAATLAGLRIPLTIPLIIIRTLAYVLVIIALWQHLRDSRVLKEVRQVWVDFLKTEMEEP
jgi:CHASE2 domain-containing sensor protein